MGILHFSHLEFSVFDLILCPGATIVASLKERFEFGASFNRFLLDNFQCPLNETFYLPFSLLS
jgi:hypothetical protein